MLSVFTTTAKPAPVHWDPAFFVSEHRPSAVLVLLIADSREKEATPPSVVFIRRSTRSGVHRGQIGFPGGRFEPGDLDPSSTALRETEEEIGISSNNISILGAFSVVTALDGSSVVPVLGLIDRSQFLVRLNSMEVDAIFEVPHQKFQQLHREQFEFNMFGCWRRSFLYDCGGFRVWGLSAQILSDADFREDVKK